MFSFGSQLPAGTFRHDENFANTMKVHHDRGYAILLSKLSMVLESAPLRLSLGAEHCTCPCAACRYCETGEAIENILVEGNFVTWENLESASVLMHQSLQFLMQACTPLICRAQGSD